MDINAWTLFPVHPSMLLGNVAPPFVVLLYLGPESIMPVGSFLAAAVGIFLIFWRQTLSMARSSLRKVFVRKPGHSRVDNEVQVPGPGQDRAADGRD